jgi:hypothetical protein
MRPATLFCCFTFLIFSGLEAQVLSGRVSSPDGEAIAYARVYIENTSIGVLAREDGSYALRLPPGGHRVVFEHLGYLPQTFEVEMRGERQLNVVLQPSGIRMETIEITAGKRDPAYAIMEQVIAHKREHLREQESYVRETYTRVRLLRDTLPGGKQAEGSVSSDENGTQVMIGISGKKKKAQADSAARDSTPPKPRGPEVIAWLESQATGYYAAPGRYRSVVHAYLKRPVSIDSDDFNAAERSRYEMLGDDPYMFQPDPARADFNFYRNLVEVLALSDRPWISPLHSELWKLTYTYRLAERRYDQGRVVYVIEVKPRNRESQAVEGFLYVVDGLWALESAELSFMPGAMNFFETFSLRHRYALESGRWVLAEEEYRYRIRDGKDRLEGYAAARHSDYRLDVEHPPGFFGNEVLSAGREAFEQDSAAWQQLRELPLDSLESSFLRVQDSLIAKALDPETLRKADSAYNRLTLLDVIVNGIGFRVRPWQMEFYLYSIAQQIRPLGVGGYRHALGGTIDKTFRNFRMLHFEGEADYGIVNRDLKGYLRTGYTYNPRRFARFDLRLGDEYTLVNLNETITAFLSRNNFINKRSIGASHRFEAFNGLMLTTAFDFADRKAIDQLQLEEWSEELFGESNAPRQFDPYRELLIDIRIRYTPFQKYQMQPLRKVLLGSQWPTFELQYKKAIPGFLGSEIDFDFLQLKIEHEFRPGIWGISRWSLAAGTYLSDNNLRFNDYVFFRGSDPYLFVNPLRNFQLLGRTLSTPNEYLRLHYVHDFGRMLLNKVPLVRRTKLEMTAGAGALWVNDADFFHSEVFAGLQYPFRIRRQRFKFGAFFVAAYGTYPQALDAQVKFGFNVYDSFRRRWEY